MSEQILDGKGKGNLAEVNNDNKLSVSAIVEPIDRWVNVNKGTAWSIDIADQQITGAGADFAYIKNDGNKTLAITDFRFTSTVPGRITIKKVAGTASFTSGSDPSITARNLGSSKEPEATIKICAAVSGVSNQGVIFYLDCPTSGKIEHIRTSSNIIINQGQAVSMSNDQNATTNGIISIVELN